MSTRRRFLGLMAAAPVAAALPSIEPAAEVVEAVAEPVILPPSGGQRIEWTATGYRLYDEHGVLRLSFGS